MASKFLFDPQKTHTNLPFPKKRESVSLLIIFIYLLSIVAGVAIG